VRIMAFAPTIVEWVFGITGLGRIRMNKRGGVNRWVFWMRWDFVSMYVGSWAREIIGMIRLSGIIETLLCLRTIMSFVR